VQHKEAFTFFGLGISNELVGKMAAFLAEILQGLSSSSISSTSTGQALAFFLGGTDTNFPLGFGFSVRVCTFLLLSCGIVFEGSILAICGVLIWIMRDSG
jgi:hypothetical protein